MAEVAKTAAVKAAPAPKPKKEAVKNPCLCGCGGTSGGHFVQGHDGRVYGWIVAGTKGKYKQDGTKAKVDGLLKKHVEGHAGLASEKFKVALREYDKALRKAEKDAGKAA